MENNCTLRPLTRSRNSEAYISFSQPTAPIHRAVMAPMPAISFDLLLTTWHLQNIPITPTYFDFFCNHTIDFKSKNPISNLWRNKLINNTTMIFFNFYSTISCFFIQNRNSQATWLWPVIFTLEILYNPLDFSSSSSSLTLLQDDTVTWLSRQQSQAPFATV